MSLPFHDDMPLLLLLSWSLSCCAGGRRRKEEEEEEEEEEEVPAEPLSTLPCTTCNRIFGRLQKAGLDWKDRARAAKGQRNALCFMVLAPLGKIVQYCLLLLFLLVVLLWKKGGK